MLCKEKMFAQITVLDLYSLVFVTTTSGPPPESQNPLPSILVVFPVGINAEETSGHVGGPQGHMSVIELRRACWIDRGKMQPFADPLESTRALGVSTRVSH